VAPGDLLSPDLGGAGPSSQPLTTCDARGQSGRHAGDAERGSAREFGVGQHGLNDIPVRVSPRTDRWATALGRIAEVVNGCYNWRERQVYL
jgi:hypothetical protein